MKAKTSAIVAILALLLAGCATAPSNPVDFSPRTDATFAGIALGLNGLLTALLVPLLLPWLLN